VKLPPPPPAGRVLGLYHEVAQANAYYRVVAPLSVLPSASWASYATMTAAQVEAAEVVVCSRLGGRRDDAAAFIRDWQARGVRVVLDFDDDYFGVWPKPPADPAAREALIASVAHAITLADAVVVANERLAEVFAARTDAPVYVSPNRVRADWWTPPAPRAGAPVIGLLGSSSHHEDWRQVAGALARVRREWPEAIVWCVGYLPDYLDGVATDCTRWVSLREFMGCVNACDLILAPLADTPFNRGKSPGRALEAGLAGAPLVGSPTVYGPILRAAGLPIPTAPGDWYDAIAGYLSEPALREAHGRALQALVCGQYDVRRHSGALASLYHAEEATYGAH
jgi:glycosyltransferase involved in cell wall biosynthesis